MRAETVHVTDHAMLRWKERASKTGEGNVHEIVKAVKNSRVIKKSEPLPYPLPRLDGSVYTFNAGVMFILESVTIDEYRLVTVIADSPTANRPTRPPKINHSRKRNKHAEVEKIEIDIPSFDTAIQERCWLTDEKRRLERELAVVSKKSNTYKELLKVVGEIEDRLTENKPRYIKERDGEYQDEQERRKTENEHINYGATLLTILRELRELRSLVEAKHGEPRAGSPIHRTTTGPVHVQPPLPRVSDLATEGYGPVPNLAQSDAAA